MLHIDIGDLSISHKNTSLQQALFDEIRAKIINKLWLKGAKLPSTRKAAEELKISRNTVTSCYEQLVAEGYIESKKGSGFFVSVSIPETYLQQSEHKDSLPRVNAAQHSNESTNNQSFAPGIPDLHAFPYSRWQKILQHHSNRALLAGAGDIQGLPLLREALSQYLASARSVDCTPKRIIITSGAQQALTIAMLATLQTQRNVLMEDPGYTQMRKVLSLFNFKITPITVSPSKGIDVNSVLNTQADAIYLTPSNQYPMGTSLDTEQRLNILKWAAKNKSWIIEDDYDSEFQYAHRPYASLQGLAHQSGLTQRCIYVGSFSKTMFNGLRIGYMVVPDSLVDRCLTVKDALCGSSPAHYQAALAEFIIDGHFLRHLRKMRKLYQQKHAEMLHSINRYFGENIEIISQAAGLHITMKWESGPDEKQFSLAAKKEGITVRPLLYYQHNISNRHWNAVVLGYGNTPLEQIDILIARLYQLFQNI